MINYNTLTRMSFHFAVMLFSVSPSLRRIVFESLDHDFYFARVAFQLDDVYLIVFQQADIPYAVCLRTMSMTMYVRGTYTFMKFSQHIRGATNCINDDENDESETLYVMNFANSNSHLHSNLRKRNTIGIPYTNTHICVYSMAFSCLMRWMEHDKYT